MSIERFLKKNRIPRQQCQDITITIVVWVLFLYTVGNYLRLVQDQSGEYTIPKILHKTSKSLLESDIQTSFFKECEEMYVNDGWEVKLWYDDDIDTFVSDNYPQYYLRFKEITPKIKQIDAVRYLFMYHYGGIYTDMDAECIRPASRFVDGIEKGQTAWLAGYPEPFFLMSTVSNEFWIFAFELILRDWKKYNVRSTAGPQGLNRMAKAYVALKGSDAIRPFVMHDQSECDTIEPKGDVVCGQPTFRWIEAKDSFQPSQFPVQSKIGFIPNKIVDPTACLSRIGNCKNGHCHDRVDVKPFLFVHHCLFSWRNQAQG